MSSGRASASHDWSTSVDVEHLERIRRDPKRFASTGALHLLAEVLAYADDEAERTGSRRCRVVLRPGGSVSVVDNGRGTDTRVDVHRTVKKPVMSTPDLRFFDADPPSLLPDGGPRRGMSVVAALSSRLVHVNRRRNGSWRQVYAFGVPVTDLQPVDDDGTTGTTVEFVTDDTVRGLPPPGSTEVTTVLAYWPNLDVELVDLRSGNASNSSRSPS